MDFDKLLVIPEKEQVGNTTNDKHLAIVNINECEVLSESENVEQSPAPSGNMTEINSDDKTNKNESEVMRINIDNFKIKDKIEEKG